MSKAYDDPRFGVEQMYKFPTTGALNGTVASATDKYRLYVNKAMILNNAALVFTVGGTEASAKHLVLGKSLAGTGTVSAFGTVALGTQANLTSKSWTVSGTLAAGDALVLQHYGTSTAVYDVIVQAFMQETFA